MLINCGGFQKIPSTFKCGGVVQLVEHRPSDPIVVGSSPAASAKENCPGSAELVDAWDLRSYGLYVLAGSSPALGTKSGWFRGIVVNIPSCHEGVASSILVGTAIYSLFQ